MVFFGVVGSRRATGDRLHLEDGSVVARAGGAISKVDPTTELVNSRAAAPITMATGVS